MRTRKPQQVSQVARSLVLAGTVLAGTADAKAQAKVATLPDAQVESNVLRALAANTNLANQQISSAAVYGVVTLSGHVKDDTTRSLADDLVSRTAGVQKVIDEVTIADQTVAEKTAPVAASQGSDPQLQSNRTVARSAEEDNQTSSAGQPPLAAQPRSSTPQQPTYDPQAAQSSGESGQPGQTPVSSPQSGPPSYEASANQPYGEGGQPSYTGNQPSSSQSGQSPYGQNQPSYNQSNQPPYTEQSQPPYSQSQPPNSQGGQPPHNQNQPPYGPPSRYPYGSQRLGPPPQRPYASGGEGAYGQPGGQVVAVPAGTIVQLRLDQGIDSKHAQIGGSFSGTVLRDVVANGFVAVPRGASVQGIVVDATSGGAIKGRASLALQLTQVTLGGRVYPLTSTIWGHDGPDKTVRTVDSALGLGVVGAIIGGVAGGGTGAAIGAGAGGAAGIGASAASGNGQVFLPPESVITFQFTQSVTVATVSQAEMERLAYSMPGGVPPGMRRRYPPPPYLYGPGYYYSPRVYYRPYPY